MERTFYVLGSFSAFIAVAAGAFGAHGVKGRLSPEMLSIFEVGVRYQMYHAFAIIAAACAQSKWSAKKILAAGWFFIAGTIVFSGSLYMLGLSGIKWLGAITPLGGIAFLLGWGCLAWGALKRG